MVNSRSYKASNVANTGNFQTSRNGKILKPHSDSAQPKPLQKNNLVSELKNCWPVQSMNVVVEFLMPREQYIPVLGLRKRVSKLRYCSRWSMSKLINSCSGQRLESIFYQSVLMTSKQFFYFRNIESLFEMLLLYS